MPLATVGGFIAGGSVGTRRLIDWDDARDLGLRELRLKQRPKRLGTSSSSPSLGGLGASQTFVITRGPLSTSIGSLHSLGPSPSVPTPTRDAVVSVDVTVGWRNFESQCRRLFDEFDRAKIGVITLSDLEESFHRLHLRPPILRMNHALFQRYLSDVLPANCEGVNFEEFLQFHRRVWENQPIAVRQNINGVHEVYSSEALARKVFAEYSQNRAKCISKQDLPSAMQDLGLYLDSTQCEVVHEAFENFARDVGGIAGDRMTFHEFVRFKNYFIDMVGVNESRVAKPVSGTSA